MQFKVFIALILSATLSAAFASSSSSCTTGSLQCCNSTVNITDKSIAKVLEVLKIKVQDKTIIVGVTCSPITAIGASGTSCSEQPVCCTDSNFNGVVALNCTAVNLNI